MDRRLKSRSVIETIFKGGQSLFTFPIKVVYVISEEEGSNPGLQIGVSVSKKYFKRAVDRNLIKRRMREAIRLAMPPTTGELKDYRAAMFIYIAHEIQDYEIIFKSIKKLLPKLVKTT